MADNDDLHLMAGRIEGKLDTFREELKGYLERHEGRHVILDQHLLSIQSDINQAKGAKSAFAWIAAGVSAGMAYVVTNIPKWLK